MKKAVLGYSGGVDSSVAAVLLRQQGYEVLGLYLDNTDEQSKQYALSSAEQIGIPLQMADVHAELEEKVCRPFAESYLRGETPNPCILCNPALKFDKLLSYADAAGADYIATGHYAVTSLQEDGRNALLKGNPENDQSYMLCRLKRSQLDRLLLPLGAYAKKEVRAMAEQFALPSAHKPDSMEICFIPDKDYQAWLARRAELPPKGRFILHGEDLGEHSGIHCYTVGQRLPGLVNGRKVYISRIRPDDNTVELAFWEELFKTTVYARDFSFLCDLPDGPFRANVRVRHTKWENPECTVYPLGDRLVRIECDEAVRAPAAGQTAALYSGDRVIGGGFIFNPA